MMGAGRLMELRNTLKHGSDDGVFVQVKEKGEWYIIRDIHQEEGTTWVTLLDGKRHMPLRIWMDRDDTAPAEAPVIATDTTPSKETDLRQKPRSNRLGRMALP
jgi:hypothetical protein